MSAMQDLKKTWGDKFGGELPSINFWMEDVRNNLEKRKARVEELKKSLKEEEEYVKFLENLLEEITGNKAAIISEAAANATPKSSEASSVSEQAKQTHSNIDDVIKDTLHRRCQSINRKQNTSKDHPEAKEMSETNTSTKEDNQNGTTKVVEQTNGASASIPPPVPEEQKEKSQNDGDHFVTVIEVNGQEKKVATTSNSQGDGSGEEKRKPIPPIPPPKNIKRGASLNTESIQAPTPPSTRLPFSSFGHGPDSTNRPHETVESKLRFVEDKNCLDWLGERNVVFDSRGKSQSSVCKNGEVSSSSGSSSTTSSLSSSAKENRTSAPKHPEISAKPDANMFPKPSQPKKKFEGSKLLLPNSNENSGKGPQSPLQRKTMVPSSLDLNSTSASPQAERRPQKSKISDMIGKLEGSKGSGSSDVLTPKLSFRDRERNNQRGQCSNGRRKNSDSMMADYMDPCDAEGYLVSEEIYDLPPESPVVERISESDPKATTTTTSTSHGMDELELEPMYDTVAPDQEHENDDDYVVLLEQEGAAAVPSTSNNSNSIPPPRKRKESKNDLKSESATIRSQTSVFSGHSITTTSSGTTSDTECFTESPLPEAFPNGRTPSSNYVNIDYFLRYFLLFSYKTNR